MNNFITRLSGISTIAAMTACGGGDADSNRYIGTSLVIDGITYSQQEILENIVPGEIVVVPKEGMREEVRKLIAGFGLKILREDRVSLLVIIPLGYEAQWATVFKKHSAVESASPSLLPGTDSQRPI